MDITRINEEHWHQYRDLRLEMLADTPYAYLETAEEAAAQPESEWRFRARRCAEPGSIGLAAVSEGRWIGTMSAYRLESGLARLVGVYLSPEFRGGGAADVLLDGIRDWLVDELSARRLVLEVHEKSQRAQAFYRRRGFLPTGERIPYPLDESQQELVMVWESTG